MPPHGARGVPGGGASGATALPVRLLQVECGLAPPLRSLQQLPAALPRSFAAADEASGRALTHLLELRQASQTHNPRAARDALHSLSGACEFLTPGMEARTSAPARAAQGLVVSTGGWQLLLTVLSPSWDSQPDNASPLNPHLLADIRAEACAILRELCCAVPSLSEAVAATPGLGARLFRLAANPVLVDVCTALLEETLPLRRTMLDLSTECGDLADMLLGVGAPQLTCLCRALMVVVYESDPQSEEDKEDDALAGSRQGGPRFCDANHGALLAVPGLIARLVRVLRLRTLPPFMFTADQQQHWRLVTYLMRVLPQGADTVLPRLMTLLTASPQRTWEDVNLQAATLQPGERLDAVSRFQLNGEPEPVGRVMDEAGDEEGHPDYMQRPAHHGDVLFLLCTLMQGAHKTAAQEAVTAAGFPAVASLLYDAIDWQSPDHDPGAPAGGLHGPDCTCSARSALRIQYLRCVHAFIERDGNCAAGEDSSRAQKLSLLSPEEIAHFYPEHAPQAAAAGSSQRSGDAGKKQASSSRPRGVVAAARQRLSQCMHMTRSVSRAAGPGLVSDPAAALVVASPVPAVPVNLPPGLMTKLVRQYMTAPHDVSHRFWLASCADAFVRGAVHSDQRLVAHTGLLLHLLRDILHHDGSRPTGSLQSCCDILAEMVKGNSGLWDELQGLLHDMGDPACERLAAIVMAHLVDSNMLIRSGILSMNALRTVDGDAAAPGGEQEEEGEGDLDMTDAAEQPLRCEEPSRLARAAAAAASEAAGHESADAMPLCVWLGFGSCPRNIWFEWLNANWLDVLAALVDAVPSAELDSECVCTTNTALVMLLLARRAGCLAACLGALAQHPRQPGDPRPPPCVGFHATLRVWAKSYLAPWPARDRDRRSLEHATGFDFLEFRDLATVLLSDNTDSPVALLHYA